MSRKKKFCFVAFYNDLFFYVLTDLFHNKQSMCRDCIACLCYSFRITTVSFITSWDQWLVKGFGLHTCWRCSCDQRSDPDSSSLVAKWERGADRRPRQTELDDNGLLHLVMYSYSTSIFSGAAQCSAKMFLSQIESFSFASRQGSNERWNRSKHAMMHGKCQLVSCQNDWQREASLFSFNNVPFNKR